MAFKASYGSPNAILPVANNSVALAIPGTYLIMESNNFVPFPIIDVGFSLPANIVFMDRFLKYN